MALFQTSVQDKYLKQLDNADVLAKWAVFTACFHNTEKQQNIRDLNEEQYQAGFLRDLFVNVFGYTLAPDINYNLTTEYKNVKDAKKADGAIIIKGEPVCVIELKGTDTTDIGGKVETQAFGYKNNHPKVVYIVTSNFEKLRFYIENAVDYIEFNLFTLSLDEFRLLYLCLNLPHIQNGLPKKIKDESVTQEDKITKQLYKDYAAFKTALFDNIRTNNPQFDALVLYKSTQKLLDRLLFIFFAEDRQLLPPNSIRRIIAQWQKLAELDEPTPLYARLKKYFGYMNTGFKGKEHDIFAYNGGLFLPDEVLDNITIDDEVLHTYAIKLSDYNYQTEVDVNILGHIFENSLNELDEVKATLEGREVDKSKTKRKKDGVFYTPKYITKYIVENTVGRLCAEKKAELGIVEEDYTADKKRNANTKKALDAKLESYRNWLLQITIVDPACGSGAFLNQALDFLITEHRYIDELRAKLFGYGMVLTDVENSILENNLFGVDINEESVDIAKLSLWLRTAQPRRKLNNLNNNIKCGNSLIDDPAVAGEKAFNWQTEFKEVFAKGGFDVVIGNPPYVDIKALDIDIVKALFKHYKTAENRINLYSIFIEKGYDILKDKGYLSFINPNSILVNSSYSKIRDLVVDDISTIIKLPDDVFEDASVETIIFEFRKKSAKTNAEVIVYSNNEKIDSINTSRIVIFDKSNWKKDKGANFNIYVSKGQISILKKIEKGSVKLGDLADFSLGITPYDKYQGHTEETISSREFHSESKIDDSYKPLITGENITRFYVSETIKEYIKYGSWLGAQREERFFTEPRVLIRQIVSGKPPRIYAGYTDEPLYFTQIGFGIIPKVIKPKYLLCLINSTLINFYHKFSFLDLEKELFQKILIANCKQFPIKEISPSSQQPFIAKADEMLRLNKELQEAIKAFATYIQSSFGITLTNKLQSWHELDFAAFAKELNSVLKKAGKPALTSEKEFDLMPLFNREAAKAQALQTQIATTDKEIDQMVYKLYELTDEEIKIVEGV